MNRPLIITDCDGVLLHMIAPFAEWVDAEHGVEFRMEDAGFANALRRKECGTVLEASEVWPLLDGFFHHAMDRQYPIEGAFESLHQLSAIAEIVVLSNVGPGHQARRAQQIGSHGLHTEVIGSFGGKGEPVRALVEEKLPCVTVFIDDLANHHDSVAEAAPEVWRLHMVGEPSMIDVAVPAHSAHHRIDDWTSAHDWIAHIIAAGEPAPPLSAPVARA